MNEHSIRELFARALQAIESVPEQLQQIAFSKAIDLLAPTQPQLSKPSIRPSREESRSTTRRKAPNRVGPQSVVATLVADSYFGERRTTGAIQAYIKDVRGHDFPSKDLAKALLRAVRDGALRRERNGESQYEYWRP